VAASVAHWAPVPVFRLGYALGRHREVLEETAYVNVTREAVVARTRLLGETIPLAIYRSAVPPAAGTAAAAAGAPAAMLFLHGGGHTIGSIETHDNTCRLLAGGTGLPVVSVAYSLAPEAPITAARNSATDCMYAYAWLAANFRDVIRAPPPTEDPAPAAAAPRIVVCGDSAGGHLTFITALLVRAHNAGVAAAPATAAAAAAAATGTTAGSSRAGVWAGQYVGRPFPGIDVALPPPALLAPIYPATTLTHDTPSAAAYATGYELTAAMMTYFEDALFGYAPAAARPALRADTFLSPLENPDLGGLPTTLLLTAQYDVLHDEGVAMVAALRAAGTLAEHIEAPGLIHGFITHLRSMPSGRVALTTYAHRIRDALAGVLPATPTSPAPHTSQDPAAATT